MDSMLQIVFLFISVLIFCFTPLTNYVSLERERERRMCYMFVGVDIGKQKKITGIGTLLVNIVLESYGRSSNYKKICRSL